MSDYCPKCAVAYQRKAPADKAGEQVCNGCGYSARRIRQLPWLLLSLVLSLAVLYFVTGMKNFDLHYPMVYRRDALLYYIYIKMIIDNGWYYVNNMMGMPFGMITYDFHSSDLIFLFFAKLCTLFTDNVFVAGNICYLITYPLVALTSSLVMLRIGLNGPLSVAGSLLYTFLPYHLIRGEFHMEVCYYFLVPVSIYLCLRIFSERPPFFGRGNVKMKSCLRYGALALLLGLTFEYYAFYSCFLFVVAGAAAALYRRKFTPIVSAALLSTVLTAALLLAILPNFYYVAQHGKNRDMLARSVQESERYALKITQMLLPVKEHRNVAAAAVTENYINNSIPVSGESLYSALGIVGAFGLLALFAILIHRTKSYDNDTLFGQLSTLNIAAVLYGTVGGFASVFAIFVSPIIRAHARLSIFIAFFAILCLLMLVQKYLLALPQRWSNVGGIALAGALLLFGLWDQSTAAIVPKYQNVKAECIADADFTRNMESLLPAGSMVFQLPFAYFPEHPVIHNLQDYELGKPYLHSSKLRWTYGAINGRESSKWQKAVADKPVEEFLSEIRKTGFRGIYIDRRGFADSGREMEEKLKTILKREPLISSSGLQSFFVL